MKDNILHVRINSELLDNLKEQATTENTNLSQLVDRIARNYLQENRKEENEMEYNNVNKLEINQLKEDIKAILDIYLADGTVKTEIKIKEMGINNKKDINRIVELASMWNSEFNSLECDPEGYNDEQQKVADELDDEYINDILDYILDKVKNDDDITY